ncbi:MAG: transcription elongation factor GreA [Bacilli bacterium]|nr:transcription elongation factor GreA [Bacilli bacterium]
MVNKIELTKEGAEKLEKELRHLIDIDRPEVIEALQAARSQGDLSENADYDAARTKQAEIEGRIKEIENILANVKIISEKTTKSKGVVLGSKVTIKDLSDDTVETYTIVGTVEANPLKGLISNVSPLGRAVVDKNIGDIVSVHANKEYKVEILNIEYK